MLVQKTLKLFENMENDENAISQYFACTIPNWGNHSTF